MLTRARLPDDQDALRPPAPEVSRVFKLAALPRYWHPRGRAALNPEDIRQILSFETELGRFAIWCNSTAMEAYRKQTGETGISLPDLVAMSIALDTRGVHLGQPALR